MGLSSLTAQRKTLEMARALRLRRAISCIRNGRLRPFARVNVSDAIRRISSRKYSLSQRVFSAGGPGVP